MPSLPYVIDNREHRLADVLDALLRGDAVHALDIATAYFNIGAFQLLQTRLPQPAAGARAGRQGEPEILLTNTCASDNIVGT